MVITEGIERARRQLTALAESEGGKKLLHRAGVFSAGLGLSAAGLDRSFQPIAMGLVCAAPPGPDAVLIALGAGIGYPLFWGRLGLMGSVWCLLGLVVALTLGDRGITQRQWALLPSLGALIVSATGLWFLLGLNVDISIRRHLVNVAVGTLSPWLFVRWRRNRDRWTEWAVRALAVLALAQIWPARYLGLGFVGAGYLAPASGFTELMLLGLGLDLSQVTRVKMTVVLCAGFCLGKLPRVGRLGTLFGPAIAYVPAALLTGAWDVRPLPGLILGGALSAAVPGLIKGKPEKATGAVAVAQVRLEQMALAMQKMEQSLTRVRDPEPDARGVLERCRASACDTCPERRHCKARSGRAELSTALLEQPGLGEEDLPEGCRKPARLLGELRRGQTELRRLRGEQRRQGMYRVSVRDQYGYLSMFLQGLSDDLAQRQDYRPPRFTPEIGLASRNREAANGDHCVWFAGPGNGYYVLLCDGMGTGEEAARESMAAAELLKTMLSAGFPAEYALRSLNSLSMLRNFGGCTTVDLLELWLDTGKGKLYKWGAAPSYLLTGGQCRKIGTAGPPPGLSESCRETTERLSLGRGETLILLSDGVSGAALLNSARTTLSLSPGEMAAAILEQERSGGDDATAAVIRLMPCGVSTQ